MYILDMTKTIRGIDRFTLAMAVCLVLVILTGCDVADSAEHKETAESSIDNTHSAEVSENGSNYIADFGDMTGEEIRLAYLRGEVSAHDMFISSDVDYLNARLDALFLHYTDKPNDEFSFNDYEPAPNGLEFGKAFTLDNCEILSYDANAETPIKLRYTIGDYYFYVGFAPFDIFIDTQEELSQVQWHLNLAYFVPIADGIVKPYAQFDTISIYIQENPNGRSLKAVDHATGYSIYQPAYLTLYELDKLSMSYNGKDMVAIQEGDEMFSVLDFSGRLYYNNHILHKSPYLNFYSYSDRLINEIRWIDENTLEGETERGIFNFKATDYLTIDLHDDGTYEIITLSGPIEYVFEHLDFGSLPKESVASLMKTPIHFPSATYPAYYWLDNVIKAYLVKYTVIDLDGDSICETIFRVGKISNEYHGYLIFHTDGESTYAHYLYDRAFMLLKTDGTFHQNGGLGDLKYAEMGFEGDEYTIIEIARSESFSLEDTHYYICGKEVTSEEYQKFLDEQSNKPDAVWYDVPKDYMQINEASRK